MEVSLIDTKQYSQTEVAAKLSSGLGPEALACWPLVTLPTYVADLARADLMEPEPDDYAQEQLDEALRPRRGFRTEWGVIVAEIRPMDDATMVEVSGYLNADPFLKLPQIRSGATEAGIFLGDLVFAALEVSADAAIFEVGMAWEDNDQAGQIFSLIGFSEPGEEMDLEAVGRHVGVWLAGIDLPALVVACQDRTFLSELELDSGLPITESVVSPLN